MSTSCGCPGCRAPINPGLVWAIKDRLEKYCSRECRDAIWDHYNDGKKVKKMPHVLADDFGDAGVIRRKPDKCGAQILLCWKGPDGEYCSNACKKQAIAEGEKTMTETTTATATAAAPSPIVAGAPAPSKAKKAAKKATKPAKAAKKATAKKAPAKKAKAAKAPKAAKPNGYDKYIIMAKKEELMKSVKKGMTPKEITKELGWKNEATTRNQISRICAADGISVSLLPSGHYRLDK